MSNKKNSQDHRPASRSCKECMSYDNGCGGRRRACELFEQRYIISEREKKNWPKSCGGAYGSGTSTKKKSLSQEELLQKIASTKKKSYSTVPSVKSKSSNQVQNYITYNKSSRENQTEKREIQPSPVAKKAEIDRYTQNRNSSIPQKQSLLTTVNNRKVKPFSYDDVDVDLSRYYPELNRYLVMTYAGFLANLQIQDSIKSIKGFVNRTGRLPDYSNKINQGIHELRFVLSNFIEYYVMYSQWYRLLSSIHSQNQKSYSIISLGCGSTCDYFSLLCASADQKNEPAISYLGIDPYKWLPFYCSIQKQNRRIENMDAAIWLKYYHFEFAKIDVIVFPKSIGEISQQSFEEMLQLIVSDDCKLKNNKISILGSFEKKSHSRDKERYDKFVDVIKEKNGFSKCSKIASNLPTDSPAHSSFGDVYPDSICMKLTSLESYCALYRRNHKHCENHRCPDQVLVEPVLSTQNIDYEITVLEK